MANGIVTPPDYRAAEGIKGFVGGLQAGVGIARDVQGIKQNKVAAERKKVTDAQADEDRDQDKKDTHVQRIPDYLRSTVAAAYAGKDTEAADILNMVFVPDPKTGVAPVKALRVSKIQAEDGTPTIEVEYEGGKIVQVDPKVARNWANGMRNETPDMDGTSREELRAAETAVRLAESKLADAKKGNDKAAIAAAQDELDSAAEQYESRSNVKMKFGKGAGNKTRDDLITKLRVKKTKARDAGASPAELQAIEDEITAARESKTGTGIPAAAPEGGTPAPVATTGPAASGTKKAPPAVGEVRNGYKYNGGNPADPASWEKVQ